MQPRSGTCMGEKDLKQSKSTIQSMDDDIGVRFVDSVRLEVV